jgi:acyl-CoA synthetase (AMP-forming)/AMP-acid ligase II
MSNFTTAKGPAFAADLERWGEAAALVMEDGEAVSYAELARLADEFAATLRPDVHLLAISMANELAPVAAYLGALRKGLPVVLYSGTAAATGVFASCPPDATFEASPERWTLRQKPQAWTAPPHPDLALLLSTSGSTGNAKLVRLSARNVGSNAAAIAEYLEIGPADRAITSLPLSYSYGLSVLNSHLAAGASLALTERSVAEPEFRMLMERHGVTSLAGVPHSYELMDRVGLLDRLPRTLRTLTQAGGRMEPDMIRRIAARVGRQGARLFVMYGQTEAGPRIAYLPPDKLPEYATAIGGPVPGGEIWVEEHGVRLPAGREGDLMYRGPNVMMGYATRREELGAPAGSDVLNTGDIAVEAAPGIFRITGRKSRFVKPFGVRVGLDELEQRFRAAGARALVTGDDQLIVACGPKAAEAAARASFDDLPLSPELLEFVAADPAPRLSGGKPDYVEILRRGRAQRAATTPAPGDMAGIEDLFQRLAQGKPLAGDASFERLGGDSLSYVQCSLVIEDALGELPERWETLSIAELRALAARRTAKRTGLRWKSLEGDILVRAAAILLILANHAFSGLGGGADVLMVLAGYSWARFQRRRLGERAIGPVLRDFGRRYLVFYVLTVLAVSLLNRQLAVSHLLLVSSFLGDWGGILNTYWFIECLTWCVAMACLAAAIPPLRRLMVNRPLTFGIVFVVVGLAARIAGEMVIDPAKTTAFRSPDQMLIYFAVGWAAALAKPAVRAALLAVLLGMTGLAWGLDDTHVYVLCVAAVVLVLMRRVILPGFVASAVSLVAAASFYIYLINPLPMYVTDQILHARYGGFWWLQIGATLVGGVGMYLSLEWLLRLRQPMLATRQAIEAI